MSYTITGKVHRMGQLTSKESGGKTYHERAVTLVIQDGNYPNYPTFIVKKEDTAKAVGNVSVGSDITLHFDVRGFEYADKVTGEQKNFTQAVFWKYETSGATSQQSAPAQSYNQPPAQQNSNASYTPNYNTSPETIDDLPF